MSQIPNSSTLSMGAAGLPTGPLPEVPFFACPDLVFTLLGFPATTSHCPGFLSTAIFFLEIKNRQTTRQSKNLQEIRHIQLIS